MPELSLARNWTPELKKRAAGVDGALIRTGATYRDGSRPADPVDPVPQGVIFTETFDDQPDYTIEQAGEGGSTKDAAPIPNNWDGVYNGTSWSPEKGNPDNHGSFEISSLNARGGTGKAVNHYRQSHTQRLITPDDGSVVIPSTVTHIRIWISTSRQFSTTKSATASVNGTDYTFSTTTAAEGSTFDVSTPPINADEQVGPVDTSFSNYTNQRPHRGVISNAIEVPEGATVSVVGGDVQVYDTAFIGNGPWRARLDRFESDSQLIKAPIDPSNPEGTEELYVEFWLKFDQDWYQRDYYEAGWFSKIFRCASVAIPGNFFSGGSSGDLGPMLYWDYAADVFGLRNRLAFRGGPHGENYKKTDVDNNHGGSLNFTFDLKGQAVGGGDSQLPNLDPENAAAHGTNLLHEITSEPFPTHRSVFGAADTWTKLAFYVKMNSAPGAKDGVMSQYINDHRVVHYSSIPWIEASGSKMVKWNLISIGGNDYFHPYPNADKFEDRYTIDDIVVSDSLPETLA